MFYPKKLLDKLLNVTNSVQVELKGVVPEDEIGATVRVNCLTLFFNDQNAL